MTAISAGLSTAAMIRAARTIFSLEITIRLAIFQGCPFCRRQVPGLADVDHVDSIWTSLPEVRLHMNLQVLGPKMALSCEQHFNVLRRGIEYGGKVRGRHFDRRDICAQQISEEEKESCWLFECCNGLGITRRNVCAMS